MKEAIDKAIKSIVESSGTVNGSADVQRLTQAALNLAHVKAVLSQIKD